MPYTENNCEVCGKNCKNNVCYKCSGKKKITDNIASKKYSKTESGKEARRRYYNKIKTQPDIVEVGN